MSTHLHFVVPDLFLPAEIASAACAGLHLPALGKILARAQAMPLPTESLEAWLCAAFGVGNQAIAPVTLQAEGGQPGTAYWLRADPVHLIPRHNQYILQPVTTLGAEEAAQLCASLNRHFEGDGLHFAAPRPQHWYVRLANPSDITTHPVSQVAGKDIHAYWPQGQDALRWHKLLNEIQMLLYGHPVNRAREARGDELINSVWPWGGGYAPDKLLRPFEQVYTDSLLADAFALVAGIDHAILPGDATQCIAAGNGETLIVWNGLCLAWQHGNLGAWRDSLQLLERNFATPLLQALRSGRIEMITLDVLQPHNARRFLLTRSMAWQFWKRPARLETYSVSPIPS